MKICPTTGLVFPDESNFSFVSGESLVATEDDVVGTSVDGRFRVLGRKVEGPWARVYDAQERLVQRPCTLKLFPVLDAEQKERFLHDLAMARRCTHENILEVRGGGIDPAGRGYVVHELLDDGQILAEVLEERPPDMATALGAVLQLARAVTRIHDFGGIHGQLHPRNVLMTRRGHVEVFDVGMGRLITRDPWDDSPECLEAQHYQAPEVSTGRRKSKRADLYSLGVLAHHLLAGRRPIEADDCRGLRDQLAEKIDLTATAPKVPEPLRKWLARLLEQHPEWRPVNAHQALHEFETACTEAGVKPAADPGGAPLPTDAPLDAAFDRWPAYKNLFAKMLEAGFPQGAPDGTKNQLSSIAAKVERLGEIATKAKYEHGNLGDIRTRAHEGRARIASQMDELNEGSKEIHDEVQPLMIAAQRHGEKAAAFPSQALETHKEVIRWEGRSGFKEPYQELADAYKQMADIIQKWWSVRSAQLACESDAAEKQEELQKVDEQLGELREALRIHESNLSDEVAACEQALGALGKETDEVELELIELASRFTAPLRAKPNLGSLFRDLAKS